MLDARGCGRCSLGEQEDRGETSGKVACCEPKLCLVLTLISCLLAASRSVLYKLELDVFL